MCLSKLTFHPEKLIWAACRTLHRVCFLAVEASSKREAAEIHEVSSEPALSLRTSPRWKNGFGKQDSAGTLLLPVPRLVPDKRWTCGSRTPYRASRSASQPPLQPRLRAPEARPRGVLSANQEAQWTVTNLCPVPRGSAGNPEHLESRGPCGPWPPLRCPRYVGAGAH